MGARSGNNYLSSLRKLKAEIWLDGERVPDPTIHPTFVQRARQIASLYDLQMEHPGTMTYRLDDGDRIGMSFIQPASVEDVRKRGAMFRRWAENHGGRLSATPDYFNAGLAGLAAGSKIFAAIEPRFGENLERYYLDARRRDLCVTYALENYPAGHASDADGAGKNWQNPSLRLIESDANGTVIDGRCRVAPAAPLAEEIIVLPPTFYSDDTSTEESALAFAIQGNARGLKLHCQTDPQECFAIFDHVTIPAERVFFYGDLTKASTLLEQTGAMVSLTHQEAVAKVVAAELRLGLAASIVEARNAIGCPQVSERLAQMIAAIELIRACLYAGEADAQPDKWGQYVPVKAALDAVSMLFERFYPAG